MDLSKMAEQKQAMNEDAVMNLLFKAFQSMSIQTVSADHPNNEIHFTPDMVKKWKIVASPIED